LENERKVRKHETNWFQKYKYRQSYPESFGKRKDRLPGYPAVTLWHLQVGIQDYIGLLQLEMESAPRIFQTNKWRQSCSIERQSLLLQTNSKKSES